MVGAVKFNTLGFDPSSIMAMVEEYRELLRASLDSPNSTLLQ